MQYLDNLIFGYLVLAFAMSVAFVHVYGWRTTFVIIRHSLGRMRSLVRRSIVSACADIRAMRRLTTSERFRRYGEAID